MRREWFPCNRIKIPLTTFLISRARAATQDLSQHSPLATPPGRLQPAAEPILLSLWYFLICLRVQSSVSPLLPGSQAQSCVCSLHNPCGHPESEIGVLRSQDRSSQRCFHRWIQRNCGISPLPLVVPRFPSLLPKKKVCSTSFAAPPWENFGASWQLRGIFWRWERAGKHCKTPAGFCGCLLGNVAVKKTHHCFVF